jgi:hypothetical protein
MLVGKGPVSPRSRCAFGGKGDEKEVRGITCGREDVGSSLSRVCWKVLVKLGFRSVVKVWSAVDGCVGLRLRLGVNAFHENEDICALPASDAINYASVCGV